MAPTIGTPGTVRVNTSRIEGDGSAAMQAARAAWRWRVSFPVPAARSSTRLPSTMPVVANSCATAASG